MDDSIVTTPKSFCFVLMPFAGEFEDIYKIGIKGACDKAGAYCERVDEQIFNERIIDRVYNQIAKADLIIADMTGRNPNVFYEVGYAHALGKLTILLTQNADDIPFDLKPFPHIVYGTKISVLRDELERRVKHYIENPPTKLSDTKAGLELYLGNETLATGNVIFDYSTNDKIYLNITVHNSSNNVFVSGDFKVGVITKADARYDNAIGTETIRLPTGENLLMMPNFPNLFPNGYASRTIGLIYYGGNDLKDEETIYVRLFTIQGSKDFPITLRKVLVLKDI